MYEEEISFSPRFWIKVGILGVVALFGIVALFSTFQTVSAGERGVVLEWGKVDRILTEGFYVINPISEDVVIVDVRVQKNETGADAASKDLQTVKAVIALNYHLDPLQVGKLYADVGKHYDERIINPAIQESVKVGAAKFTAEELISKRADVKAAILEDLTVRLSKFNILVDDFSIVNFGFSQEFDSAIEAKQVAEQQALQAKNDLERVKFESQQKVEQAKAEAESTRLQVEALRAGSEVIELRKAEALLEFAKKWNGSVPSTLFMGETGSVPLLNISK